MCRLLAMVTRQEQSPATALGETLTSFRSLSQVHCDGWGIGYWDPHGELIHRKKPESALYSADFDTAMNEARTDAALLHIRKASPAMVNTSNNTHPFVSGSVAFAHNGWLYPQEALVQLAAAAHGPTPKGDTDSELFFGLILAQLRDLEPVEAIQSAWQGRGRVGQRPGGRGRHRVDPGIVSGLPVAELPAAERGLAVRGRVLGPRRSSA